MYFPRTHILNVAQYTAIVAEQTEVVGRNSSVDVRDTNEWRLLDKYSKLVLSYTAVKYLFTGKVRQYLA